MNNIELMIAESLVEQFLDIHLSADEAKARIDKRVHRATIKNRMEALRREIGREPTIQDLVSHTMYYMKDVETAVQGFTEAMSDAMGSLNDLKTTLKQPIPITRIKDPKSVIKGKCKAECLSAQILIMM